MLQFHSMERKEGGKGGVKRVDGGKKEKEKAHKKIGREPRNFRRKYEVHGYTFWAIIE